MAERTFIPSSPACGQWETLLAEALDGLLKPADEATFSAHMAVCPACAALFEEARRGREWLEFLSPEPEVPAGLLDKILARTGPGQTADLGLAVAGGIVMPMLPAWQRPGFMGFIRRFAEPRLMMTAAMAFFSIAMTLNLTGVHLSDLRPTTCGPPRARLYGAAADDGLDADHPLLRPYEAGLRGAIDDAGAAQDDRKRRARAKAKRTGRRCKSRRRANPTDRLRHTRTAAHAVDPPQQSISPPTLNDSDFLETTLSVSATTRAFRRLPHGDAGKEHDMDCVNHNGRVAVYYCQNCGKPLCLECTVSGALGHGAKGQVLCKDCGAAWQQAISSGCALRQPVCRSPEYPFLPGRASRIPWRLPCWD